MTAKIIVVGAGIAGLSLAWALTRRGFAVELFEQGPIPNPRASSFDEHRITRHTYGAMTGYTRLMPAAFQTYEALWRDLGARHYLPTGIVYVRRRVDDWYETTARDLDAFGLAHRELTEAEVEARLPMVRRDGVRQVVEAEGAGMLFCYPILRDLAHWLERAGAVLRPGRRVADIDPEGGRVVVDGVAHKADVVVVAAGAWVTALAPRYARALTPSRQTVLYLDPPSDFRGAWSSAPVIIEEGAYHSYTLPPRGGMRLKIGDHHFSRRGAGEDDRIAKPEDIAPVAAAAADAFVDFDRYRLLEAKVCYYTVTDDESFLVEPLGRAGWIVSACSGHGFKLAPLIADGVAAAIAGERDQVGVKPWAAGRAAALQ
jgi:glycine/D-amino acid oxidase-like deaminating enzyme